MSMDEAPPQPRTEDDDIAYLVIKVAELERQLNDRETNLEDQERQLRIAELEQRNQFRQFVLIVSVLVLVFMAFVACSGVASVLFDVKLFGVGGKILTVSSSYAIALFVAPVVSITTITVALMLGTFRRFKEGDADSLAGAAIEFGKAGSGSM